MTNIAGLTSLVGVTTRVRMIIEVGWSFNLGTGGDIFGEGAEHGLAVRANRRC